MDIWKETTPLNRNYSRTFPDRLEDETIASLLLPPMSRTQPDPTEPNPFRHTTKGNLLEHLTKVPSNLPTQHNPRHLTNTWSSNFPLSSHPYRFISLKAVPCHTHLPGIQLKCPCTCIALYFSSNLTRRSTSLS